MAEPIQAFALSGAGNDFIALAEPASQPSVEEIGAWCRRGVSLGADGVFVLSREDGRVRMDYFNADGRPADLCLNGTRCAARLAFELGWSVGEVAIQTGAGRVDARPVDGDEIELELGVADDPPRQVELEVDGELYRGWLVEVGVPVLVLEWKDSLATVPMADLGPRLRSHPALGDAGANVMFVRFLTDHSTGLRSFERGVEAETLACGTGVLATAAVGAATARLTPPIRALTASGFELTVDGELSDRSFRRWTLRGDARLLARVELLPAASVPQPLPAWARGAEE